MRSLLVTISLLGALTRLSPSTRIALFKRKTLVGLHKRDTIATRNVGGAFGSGLPSFTIGFFTATCNRGAQRSTTALGFPSRLLYIATKY